MKEVIKTQKNNHEIFKELSLEINKADGIHNIEIIFNEANPKLVTAYNIAIDQICNKQHKLGMFHQTGIGNEPGYHAWEVLGSDADTQKLSGLFSSIHQKAKETYTRFEELKIF